MDSSYSSEAFAVLDSPENPQEPGTAFEEERAVAEAPSENRPSAGANSLSRSLNLAAKRLIDIAISAAGLVLLSPFLIAMAVLIKLNSPGPAIYRQTRWGKDCRSIRIFKFRTMRQDQCDAGGTRQARPNDPRTTRLGAFLRRNNIDELPQLLNVLIGEMSLVGPRCHAIGMLAAGVPYEDLIGTYHARHAMRPGITGLAQSRGYRGPTDDLRRARKRIELDLEYVQTFDLLLDLSILIRTIRNEWRGGTGF